VAPIIVPVIPPGHLGRRPGRATVLDDKILVRETSAAHHYEIRDHTNFDRSGFVLHFIPIFYGLCDSALTSCAGPGTGCIANGERISMACGAPQGRWTARNTASDGVAAHVQGDMAMALDAALHLDSVPKAGVRKRRKDFRRTGGRSTHVEGGVLSGPERQGAISVPPEVGQLIIATGEGARRAASSGVYRWRETA
jgi:hypothetical protein